MNPLAHLIARDVTRSAVIGATHGPAVPDVDRPRRRRPVLSSIVPGLTGR